MSDHAPPNGRPQDERAELAALRQECERLTLRVAELEQENRGLQRAVVGLLGEDAVIDREAMLHEFDQQPTLEQLIAELEQQDREHGVR